MLRECEQQIEFAAGEQHQRVVGGAQFPPGDIETPAAETQYRPRFGPRGSGRLLGGPAQHRLDSRQQLALVERLGQVVIGPDFKTHDAIGVVRHRGQHDDRHGRPRAQLPAQGEAVFAIQHDVENDEIDRLPFQGGEHSRTVLRHRNGVRVLVKETRQQGQNILVVVDEQKVGHREHSPRTTCAYSRLMSGYQAFVSTRTHCSVLPENHTSRAKTPSLGSLLSTRGTASMRIDKLTIAAAFAAASLLGGCATLPPGSKPDPRDRFERANRSVYALNRAVDHAILRPVAHGYVKVTPKPVRRGISNFLANIDYPITILNDALQGKVHDGLSDIAR